MLWSQLFSFQRDDSIINVTILNFELKHRPKSSWIAIGAWTWNLPQTLPNPLPLEQGLKGIRSS